MGSVDGVDSVDCVGGVCVGSVAWYGVCMECGWCDECVGSVDGVMSVWGVWMV